MQLLIIILKGFSHTIYLSTHAHNPALCWPSTKYSCNETNGEDEDCQNAISLNTSLEYAQVMPFYENTTIMSCAHTIQQ